MKKIAATLVALTFCGALAGCAAPATSSNEQNAANDTTNAAAANEAALNSAVQNPTTNEVVTIPETSAAADYSQYVGRRVDVTGSVIQVGDGSFTIQRSGIDFACVPVDARSLTYVAVGNTIEVEGTITSATDGEVVLENVTIDDFNDTPDYDDLYDDDHHDWDD